VGSVFFFTPKQDQTKINLKWGGRYDLYIQQVLRNKIKGDRSKNGKNPQSYKILPQVTQS
jgi:hypothetical protein